MPDPKNSAKPGGDTHPPEVEDMDHGSLEGHARAEGANGAPADSALSGDLQDEARAGKGINQAGYLKDKDAPGTGGDKSSQS
jgi:hypothetical protein